tara:strand:- start:3233 stop:3445 length:213 start_codon:yes stop_codon:yes gene_type:complete
MASWHNASFLRKCTDVQFKGIRLGSVNDVGHNISDEEALWLLKSSERHGVTVAEFLAAMLKDVYFEENEE